MKIHQIEGFEFSYIRSPKDMTGTMQPFSFCWLIQYLVDGQIAFFDSKAECLLWAAEFNQIGEL